MSANPQARSIAVLVVTWILTVPLLVFASQYGFSFEHGNMNTLAGSASLGLQSAASFDNIFLRVQNIGVYAICLICLWPFAQVIVGDLLLRNPLLTLLPTLCFVSSVWSQQPGHTLVASAYLTIDVCFVAYLLRRFTTDEVMQLFVLVGSIAALASLFLIVVLPQFGIENRRTDVVSGAWQGIFPQKNILGAEMTYLMSPVFFVRFQGRFARMFKWIYVASCLLLIGFSGSTGSWILCVSMLLSITFIRLMSRSNRKLGAIILCLLVILAAAALVIYVQDSNLFLKVLGKDTTMSGRTLIWGTLLISFMRSPIFGYGYEGFWTGMNGESANVALTMNFPGLSYSENGMLDLALALGLIGVVLYVCVFCLAVRDAIYCLRRNPSHSTIWFSTILAMVAVSNLTSGFVLFRANLQCMLPLLAYMGLRREVSILRAGALRESSTMVATNMHRPQMIAR